MDGECHRARKGLFSCLQELLPEGSPSPSIILAGQYSNDFLGEGREVFWEKSLLFQDLIAAGVSKKIRKLEPRDVAGLKLDLELLASECSLKLVRSHEVCPVFPESCLRCFQAPVFLPTTGLSQSVTMSLPSVQEENKSFEQHF